MSKGPDYSVPALEKGLDLLETLAAMAVPASLSELAIQLKRSTSELFRMLNCLERRGYITRDLVSGKYLLTLKLFTLAHTHSITEKLLHSALVPMQALTESVRESCHLSVLESNRLLVIAQHESPERVRLSIEVGASFDPVRTASGRLLLAQLDEAQRAVILMASESSRDLTGRKLTAFNASLEEIKRTGISTAESETIEGVRDLAVLVGNPGARITAALAVTRLLNRDRRGDEISVIAKMRQAAAAITQELGLTVAA